MIGAAVGSRGRDRILSSRESDLEVAAGVLRQGGLVAFPTETVYGIGADCFNIAAVERIFRIKGRPANNPLIVHIDAVERLEALVPNVPEAAEKLAEAFWPGPLTLVLEKRSEIPDVVTAGYPTVGVRIPDHPVARTIIEKADLPVAAPSANRSGRTSPTTAGAVLEELGSEVDAVVDGGECRVGIESTVLGLFDREAVLFRPGGIGIEDIEAILGFPVRIEDSGRQRESPGTSEAHYAPEANVIPFEGECPVLRENEAAICLSSSSHRERKERIFIVESVDDLARRLYALFREADRRGIRRLFVELPPEKELGRAVRDRVIRASRAKRGSCVKRSGAERKR